MRVCRRRWTLLLPRPSRPARSVTPRGWSLWARISRREKALTTVESMNRPVIWNCSLNSRTFWMGQMYSDIQYSVPIYGILRDWKSSVAVGGGGGFVFISYKQLFAGVSSGGLPAVN